MEDRDAERLRAWVLQTSAGDFRPSRAVGAIYKSGTSLGLKTTAVVDAAWEDPEIMEGIRGNGFVVGPSGFEKETVSLLVNRIPVHLEGRPALEYMKKKEGDHGAWGWSELTGLKWEDVRSVRAAINPTLKVAFVGRVPAPRPIGDDPPPSPKHVWFMCGLAGVDCEDKTSEDFRFLTHDNGVFNLDDYLIILKNIVSVVETGARAIHIRTGKRVVCRVPGIGLGAFLAQVPGHYRAQIREDFYARLLEVCDGPTSCDWLDVRTPRFNPSKPETHRRVADRAVEGGVKWEVCEACHDPYGPVEKAMIKEGGAEWPDAERLVVVAGDAVSWFGNGLSSDNTAEGWIFSDSLAFHPIPDTRFRLGDNCVTAAYLLNPFFNARGLLSADFVDACQICAPLSPSGWHRDIPSPPPPAPASDSATTSSTSSSVATTPTSAPIPISVSAPVGATTSVTDTSVTISFTVPIVVAIPNPAPVTALPPAPATTAGQAGNSSIVVDFAEPWFH